MKITKAHLFFLFGVCIIGFVFYSFYAGRISSSKNKTKKLQIVTTLFPLYDFARTIAGDKAEVMLLLPPGVEPHSFEPKPSDIVRINDADIFIYTGDFMEVWVKDMLKGVSNTKLTVVNASQGIALIPSVFHDEDEPAGSFDPHVWLDFQNAKKMISTIAAAIQKKDSIHSVYYKKNADTYIFQLNSLDNSFSKSLSSCKYNEIVYGGHYALGYLAKRYGLEYVAAQGVSPDAEPTANDLVALVQQINNEKIPFVFYEELTSPKIAETLANETNTKLLLLNGAHNISKEQLSEGATFISLMQNNLANLEKGLVCKTK